MSRKRKNTLLGNKYYALAFIFCIQAIEMNSLKKKNHGFSIALPVCSGIII